MELKYRTYGIDPKTEKKLIAYAQSFSISKSAAIRLLINRYANPGRD